MTAPTQLSEGQVKSDYLALCLKMTHSQLYNELMRVHREATLLIQQAVEQNNREWQGLTEEEFELILEQHNEAFPFKVYKAIEAKLKEKNHGINT